MFFYARYLGFREPNRGKPCHLITGFVMGGYTKGGIEMKEIILTQGQVALVDDEDYGKLNQYNWFADKSKNTYYAVRKETVSHKKRKKIRMHQMLIDCPDGYVVDHIDGNGLNNQKENLRAVTIGQNQQNRHVKKTSVYPGVSWVKSLNKWTARHQVNGKLRYLGVYSDEVLAFKAYYDSVLESGETVLGFDYPETVDDATYLIRPHKRPVVGININNPNDVLRFDSLTDAQRIGGFVLQSIHLCCNGKQKKHRGYKWEYDKAGAENE